MTLVTSEGERAGPGRPRGQEQQRRENRLRDLLSDGYPHPSREISDLGVDPGTLYRSRRNGDVIQLHRGVYQAANGPYDKRIEIAAASLAMPNAVVGLTTAASLHGITVEQPGLSLILPMGTRVPDGYNGDRSEIHWSRVDGAFEIGVDEVEYAGVSVRVTTPARTVFDLWRCHSSERTDVPDIFYEAFALYREKYGDPTPIGDIAEKFGRLDDRLRTLIESAVAAPQPDGEEEMSLDDLLSDEPDADEGMTP